MLRDGKSGRPNGGRRVMEKARKLWVRSLELRGEGGYGRSRWIALAFLGLALARFLWGSGVLGR